MLDRFFFFFWGGGDKRDSLFGALRIIERNLDKHMSLSRSPDYCARVTRLLCCRTQSFLEVYALYGMFFHSLSKLIINFFYTVHCRLHPYTCALQLGLLEEMHDSAVESAAAAAAVDDDDNDADEIEKILQTASTTGKRLLVIGAARKVNPCAH